MATHCEDLIKSGDETGVDCGGKDCKARCAFLQGCTEAADCATVAPYCDPTRTLCLRDTGGACEKDADCGSTHCRSGICV